MKQPRKFDFAYESTQENMLDCILEALYLVVNDEVEIPAQEQAA